MTRNARIQRIREKRRRRNDAARRVKAMRHYERHHRSIRYATNKHWRQRNWKNKGRFAKAAVAASKAAMLADIRAMIFETDFFLTGPDGSE